MDVSLEHVKRRVVLALRGDPPTELSSREIANQAGLYWSTMHSWRALERPPWPLNLVANQQYVALPVDFGQLLSVATRPGVPRLRMSNARTWNEYQAEVGSGSAGGYLGYVLHPTQTSRTLAPGTPQLWLDQEPTAAVVDAFQITYRAKWVDFTDGEEEKANIPDWCEALYLALVAAFAMGLEQPHNGSLSQRLIDVEDGPLFLRARQYDATIQPDYGPITNGAAELQTGAGDPRWGISSADMA